MTRRGLRGAAVLAAAAFAVGGCTYVAPTGPPAPRPSGDTLYQGDTSRASLEIPPDLSRAGVREAYPIPGGARSTGSRVDTVLPDVPDMRVERDGGLQRLVVAAPPGDLWQSLLDFWRAQGFQLEVDEPQVGVMETGWAEKRENLPVGRIREFLARFKRAAYTYQVRDRFRTRIEHAGEEGATVVYIAHRGAHEVVRGEGYTWAPRPSDPGLEAEMLGRLKLFLARSESSDDTSFAAADAGRAAPTRAELVGAGAHGRHIRIDEGFDRAWRLVGLALDRGGFTVADLDRSRGLYLVRYIDPQAAEPEKRGWFRRLAFWSRPDPGESGALPTDVEFRVVVEHGEGSSTRVVMHDANGGLDTSESAGRILTVLVEHIE